MTTPHAKVLLAGLLLGAAWSAVPGCIFPDYCLYLYTPGRNWCRALDGAMMWPNGHPEQAVMIKNKVGGPPSGCLCFNDPDQSILGDHTPAGQYEYLIGLLDDAARDECNSLAPAGYDNNCYIEAGLGASIISIPVSQEETYECVGRCEYSNPPPNGECPEKNPYECNDDEYGNANDEVETGSDTGDTGSETGTIESPGAFITCATTTCIIDAEYARTLWADPSLLTHDAILAFDPEQSRFIFTEVEPDTVPHALGLRVGDALESIDRVVIDDLDAAIRAYADHEHAESLDVRVARGARWVDFEFRFE